MSDARALAEKVLQRRRGRALGAAARGAIDALAAAGEGNQVRAAITTCVELLGPAGVEALKRGDVTAACEAALANGLTKAGDIAVDELRRAWIEKVRPRR